MTALREYVRLETSGLWRATPDEQWREVGVRFGEATLVIADNAGRALSHWSLPAITRLDGGGMPALFGPGGDIPEELEIDDETMIEALERVRRSIARGAPRRGRLRQGVTALVAVLAVGLVTIWLPGALMRQALASVPHAKRIEIGATMLGHVQRATGPTCRAGMGPQALAALHQRIFGPDAWGQIVVVPGDLAAPLLLPGGIVVLSQSMIETTQEPAVVAGHVLSARPWVRALDPLEPVLRGSGMVATMRLLTTGDVPGEALRAQTMGLIASPPDLPELAVLVQAFDRTRVPMALWARTLDPSGEGVLDLIEADPMRGRPVPPILSDADWVSLQNICAG
ncbi:MAG: hypothetical protein JJT81_16215 [Rubellimicrobium sp.]|nr:hypothetical protein [Rubellimicrobium sp.]